MQRININSYMPSFTTCSRCVPQDFYEHGLHLRMDSPSSLKFCFSALNCYFQPLQIYVHSIKYCSYEVSSIYRALKFSFSLSCTLQKVRNSFLYILVHQTGEFTILSLAFLRILFVHSCRKPMVEIHRHKLLN